MAKHHEEILPWEDMNDCPPEDPELHALALSLQDKVLHDKVDIFMTERALTDSEEHRMVLARSWELAGTVLIYR